MMARKPRGLIDIELELPVLSKAFEYGGFHACIEIHIEPASAELGNLNDASLQTLAKGLLHLPQLRRVYLNKHRFTDITPLAEAFLNGLRRLEELELNYNKIVNITPLASAALKPGVLTKLRSLELKGNAIVDVAPLMNAMSTPHVLKALNYVDLRGMEIKVDSTITHACTILTGATENGLEADLREIIARQSQELATLLQMGAPASSSSG
jgi:hypothetical protein